MYYRSVDVDPRTRCLNADGLDQFICLIASRNGSEQRRTRGRGALSQEGHVGRQAARLVKSSRGGYFRYTPQVASPLESRRFPAVAR